MNYWKIKKNRYLRMEIVLPNKSQFNGCRRYRDTAVSGKIYRTHNIWNLKLLNRANFYFIQQNVYMMRVIGISPIILCLFKGISQAYCWLNKEWFATVFDFVTICIRIYYKLTIFRRVPFNWWSTAILFSAYTICSHLH